MRVSGFLVLFMVDPWGMLTVELGAGLIGVVIADGLWVNPDSALVRLLAVL